MLEATEALRLTRSAKTKLKDVALRLPYAREKENFEDIHRDVLDLLILMGDIENVLGSVFPSSENLHPANNVQIDDSNLPDVSVSSEVEKVLRKLPKWAMNPNQINTKILKLFLDLESSGEDKITESLLMEQYRDHAEFLRNFNQMKMISPKNHGKVFDVKDGRITIWEPVLEAVLDFKRKIYCATGAATQ